MSKNWNEVIQEMMEAQRALDAAHGNKPNAQDTAATIVNCLLQLPASERREALAIIEDSICPHCGDEQPSDMCCQCWNDE